MQYRKLGKTGLEISAVFYGGIVSSGIYDNITYEQWGQKASDEYVEWAIEHGVNYFDVAPTYGNAQEQLGNSLCPYRDKINLACKTTQRFRAEAEEELKESMRLLHTDHFENYQLHAMKTMKDVEDAFSAGGIMELLSELKSSGTAANVGFTVHSEEVALELIHRFEFDTVLFPFNWFMNMEHGWGDKLMKAAKDEDMGVLGMKSLIERKWVSPLERYSSAFPKSWCKPIDPEDEAFGTAAMRYALNMGVDALVPPGNFDHFKFAVEHIDECLARPYSKTDEDLLKTKLLTVSGMEFFDVK